MLQLYITEVEKTSTRDRLEAMPLRSIVGPVWIDSLCLRGGTLGERHLKTATWLDSAVAVLADRHARNPCEQGLGHTAHLGVIGRQGAKGQL
jgi:hypothetical protein